MSHGMRLQDEAMEEDRNDIMEDRFIDISNIHTEVQYMWGKLLIVATEQLLEKIVPESRDIDKE